MTETLITNHKTEIARKAFCHALSTLVSMDTRLGDVPIKAIREAMGEALDVVKDLP